MSPRKLLFLTAVVLLLFAFILVYERKMPTTADKERKGDLVWEIPEARIQSMRLENAGAVVELQRANGPWRLVKPEPYPADASAVSELVSDLASLKRSGTDIPAARPEEYGFTSSSPKATIVWKDEGNDKRTLSKTLSLGKDLAGTDATAARAGNDLVFFVPSSVASAIRKSADDFKSKDVFSGSAFDAERLEIERGRGRLYLGKKNGVWSINQPVSDLADPDAVQRIVSDLTGLKAVSFLSPAQRQDLASLGLAPPLYHVTLADSKGVSTIVDFGATRADGNSVYARREGQVLTVPSTITEELSKEAVGFREPRLVRFDRAAVTGLTLDLGDHSVTLERSSGTWKTGGKALQDAAVEDLLTALLDVKSGAFSESARAAAKKVHTPSTTVTIRAPASDWTITIWPARSDTEATVSGRPGAFLLSSDPTPLLQAAFQKAATALAPTPVPTSVPTKAAKK